MDPLARLGFVASELLLGSLPEERFVPRADRAIILANRSSCLANDREYQRTIMPDNYYPSPSVFVYTLPNIVTGEIAIRNSYYGETSFYVMDNESQMDPLVPLSFAQKGTQSALTGWIECHDADHFEAHLKLITKI
jgi:3-oxoacyl-[acyl-carrier-protein] synthase-1